MDKVVATAAEAVADITDGSSLAVGGFGFCGIPEPSIAALVATGVGDLETVSDNRGGNGVGLVHLLEHKRIRRVASYAADNKEFARQFLSANASAANFNPDCARAGRITITEVDHLVEPGEIDPAAVHTPGIFVHRIVHVPDPVKPLEKVTVAR
ncbi:hypothetical protein MSAS_17870 [Mycobacterium saskatchewanense]|uniref:Succinyl-CoA--3-ketoacid-CoA transferase n=1 Tax=Mycobacterium saskatchewanense TaxID=220927 RepID=A0AAJ3NS28_9MYCO|nr:CoA-transferase [Mycobacterium saskatchewanense]ORW72866.1 hypothetical protein AWC23_08375 [Mycobacterium saskatchewanense]BBX62613.1 hypothetical protein MSAS_17870 [Mycobacterium saskatchewanense]